MSSDLQSTVQLQLLNNDVTFATLTVMVYDYILMFPSEVEYIWNKPWTWVTALYLIVRYAGIYYAIKVSLFGSTFFPGPVKFRCAGFGYSGDWAFAAFDCAASLLVVLRVHAMWNRSKVILTILLLCYTVNVVTELIWTAVFENPYVDATVGTLQVLDYSICTEVYPVIGPYEKYTITCQWPLFFDVIVFVLALVPLVKQSLAMYKATGLWEPNRYMSLIVREGVAYLFLTLLNNIPNAITNFDNPLAPVWFLILSFFYIVTLFPIFPRFVINMRELFDKDSRGRLVGIDSSFGITSRTAVSAISFVDGSTSRSGEEGGEEIQLEDVRGNDSGQGSSV